MQFSTASVMTLVLGLGLSVHGHILPRALNKANEHSEGTVRIYHLHKQTPKLYSVSIIENERIL